MFLQCTNHERSMSHDSGSKVKKPINVANLAQSRGISTADARGLKCSGMIDLDVNLGLTTCGGGSHVVWGQKSIIRKCSQAHNC